MDEMQEIIDEFLVETTENLDRLDSLFVSLESDPSNIDILAGIFRDVHTIKGTSGFLGFGKLEKVAHVGESLLSKLRDQELELNSSRTTGLLHMVDALREIIVNIEQSQTEGDGVYDPLIDQLTFLATHDADDNASSEPAATAVVAEPTQTDIQEAVAEVHETISEAEEDIAQLEEQLANADSSENEAAQDGASASTPEATEATEAADSATKMAETVAPTAETSPAESTGEKPAPAESAQAATQPVAAQQTNAPAGTTATSGAQANPAGEVEAKKTHVPAAPKADDKADNKPVRSASDSSIRVDVDLLDDLMNLVGELVLARNQILQYQMDTQDSSLQDTSQRLNIITSELQEGVMKTRMQPIGNIFSKFPRIVRDIANDLGKQINVVMEGRDTELDKTIIEAIKDPLTHMVRNSADHGIETPEDRIAKGKEPSGTLTLRAFHEGGQVNIEIEDDGAGINPSRIRDIAIQRNVLTVTEAESRSDRELINLIFAPGFSTAEKVTNVSGRGVGMDVVRTSIEGIGGSVEVFSEYGQGTTMRLRIPLTLAIIPALMIESKGERYAIPQVSLVELVRLDKSSKDIEMINGTPVHRLRGRLLPLVYLDELLGTSDEESNAEEDNSVNVVVLQAENHQFGLVVETVNDTAEIVVKPLGEVLKDIPVYAGAMVMGDGVVALILDVLGVAQEAGITSQTKELEPAEDASASLKESEPLLLFRLGEGKDELLGRMAVPLRQIDRLEEIAADKIEYASGRPVVQYRSKILPLVWLGETLGIGTNTAVDMVQVIVYERNGHQIGFIVDSISDVVNEVLEIQRPSEVLGVVGSAVINGIVTDVLDVDSIISIEAPDILKESAKV